MRRIAVLLAVLCAALAALPALAQANSRQTMTFEAPRDLLDPATRESAMNEIASLGVHSLRLVLYWHDVAPDPNSRIRPNFDATDPAGYNWGRYQPVLDEAKRRGWSVLLTVSGPVPRWATNGARDTVTRPRPKEFRMFMTAVSRKFGGDVSRYSIWNEPNQPQYLMPQYDARHRPVSPQTYRQLYFAARSGLAAANDKHPVLIGETSPRGTSHVVAPLTFLRGIACLNNAYRKTSAKCKRINADGYAHHAYTTRQGPLFKPPGPNDVTIGVLSRLTTALDRAARTGMLPKHLPIYLTEFGIQSKPDPFYGVSFSLQNEYRAISERMAYYNPRVVAFSQYLLRDDLPNAPSGKYGGFESGLRTSDGKAKPALAGFRLPLAAKRSGGKVSLWGMVRLATGKTRAVIEYSSNDRSWRKLATVTTNARGYFTKSAPYRKGRWWRLSWTAPDGTVNTAPGVQAYA